MYQDHTRLEGQFRVWCAARRIPPSCFWQDETQTIQTTDAHYWQSPACMTPDSRRLVWRLTFAGLYSGWHSPDCMTPDSRHFVWCPPVARLYDAWEFVAFDDVITENGICITGVTILILPLSDCWGTFEYSLQDPAVTDQIVVVVAVRIWRCTKDSFILYRLINNSLPIFCL